MGVVTVGEDEIQGAAGERYQTPCTDIHPRGIMNWIGANGSGFGVTLSSSVAVADYIDPTDNPVKKTILQPILLASRHSCHWEGLPYRQKGDHHFNFSFTSHETGWKHGYRFGRQANEPLIAVTKPVVGALELPQVYSFVNVENSNAIISTIKKCEDDDEVIVRLFDMEGRDGEVRVNIFREIKEAAATDLVERVQPGVTMSFDENKLSLSLGHHSIETVKLNLRK
jgi:alpha-mannosidase